MDACAEKGVLASLPIVPAFGRLPCKGNATLWTDLLRCPLVANDPATLECWNQDGSCAATCDFFSMEFRTNHGPITLDILHVAMGDCKKTSLLRSKDGGLYGLMVLET
mmetsp:Transcript_13653/g.39163  ORF Transcript_13653/g.39163 Transcript_13653/m.39163 type:complete len:108 (-) Transcript_13653:516-839(-)